MNEHERTYLADVLAQRNEVKYGVKCSIGTYSVGNFKEETQGGIGCDTAALPFRGAACAQHVVVRDDTSLDLQ